MVGVGDGVAGVGWGGSGGVTPTPRLPANEWTAVNGKPLIASAALCDVNAGRNELSQFRTDGGVRFERGNAVLAEQIARS